jgi:ribosomal protein S12 methylthiotransferase
MPVKKKKQVGIISLGCNKNRIDTEVMLGQLSTSGYQLIAELDKADIYLVNTCCFIQEATKESLETIKELVELKQRRPGSYLVVAGCLAERYGQRLLKKIPGIDALIGVQAIQQISAVCDSLSKRKSIVALGKVDPCPDNIYLNRILTMAPHSAFIRIADGCDNRCSYCVIPNIRGAFRSRKMDDILAEAEILASRGAKEINLIAQDTTQYGYDLSPATSLPNLIASLVGLKGIEWIRILYAYPWHITPELINIIASHPKVCKYLDIPLQHCSDRILRKMNRKGTKGDLIALIEKLRARIPGLVLRTTFLVGFPGERGKDFQELLKFVSDMKFERLGVFRYSQEIGTPAAKMPRQIKSKIKKERWHRLMSLQRKISFNYNLSLVNSYQSVLIDKIDPDAPFPIIGRTVGQAPEIDGQIYITVSPRGNGNIHLKPGDIVKVRVSQALEYDLIGEIVNG